MESKKTDKNSFSTQTVAYLERLFFDANDQGRAIPYNDCARVAVVHLCRPGWPGSLLTKGEREVFEKEIAGFALPLSYMINDQTIKRFCFKTVELLFEKIPKIRFSMLRSKTLKQEAARLVKQELFRNKDPRITALRVGQSLHEVHKQRSLLGNSKDMQSLKAIMDVPTMFNGNIDYSLVCAKMIAGKKKNTLMGMLKKALPFSAHTLREALGSDLYAIAKPVGYADQQEKVVLIEVTSSSASHEVHFRRNEILTRLKTIEAFAKIVDLRIKMSS